MEFKVNYINTINESKKYSDILDKIGLKLPYYQIDYFETFCNGFHNLIYFYYFNTKSNSCILMPGYLNPISIGTETTSYFDFISPYGYTGPIFSKQTKEEDIQEFWNLVDKWYSENNVISEFIRFDLNDNFKNYSGCLVSTLQNIKGVIVDSEMQWSNFEHKVRKNVKTALKEDLTVKIFYRNIDICHIKDFYNIYIDTMKRTNASTVFFYSLELFIKFIQNNEDYCAICNVYLYNEPISTELVLVSDDDVYSFLGGTLSEHFSKRPNDLLKFELINWARNMKKKHYILGGGYNADDGIFKYKKCFFPNDIVSFMTGRKIINKIIYNRLFNLYNSYRINQGFPELEITDSSFFPIYNKRF